MAIPRRARSCNAGLRNTELAWLKGTPTLTTRRFASLLLLALAISPSLAQDAAPPPPRDFVVDRAGALSRESFNRINASLKAIEDRTTAQVVVLLVNSTGGEPIEDFAQRIVESDPRWRLGQKGKDNGCLIVIAVRDRRYRIHPGYGLEGLLPDALCKRIADEHFRPNFKRGDYAQGITGAVDAIRAILSKDSDAAAAPVTQQKQSTRKSRSRGSRGTGWVILLVIFVVLSIAIGGGRGGGQRRRRHSMSASDVAWGWMIANAMRGGRGGGGWGGGGFGGGGSFGGGGGGSFGGGGASGGW